MITLMCGEFCMMSPELPPGELGLGAPERHECGLSQRAFGGKGGEGNGADHEQKEQRPHPHDLPTALILFLPRHTHLNLLERSSPCPAAVYPSKKTHNLIVRDKLYRVFPAYQAASAM